MTQARAVAVAIGRNEGTRLIRCLETLVKSGVFIIYVDSGSTDESVTAAASYNAQVISLNPNQPFTAARARNAGFHWAIANFPNLQYVQFIDGDCELDLNWIATAISFMESHSDVAATFGRLRERQPESSIYNRLCDIEWDSPIGESRSSGGIVMMRVAALKESGVFLESLIAGEEPELCMRLRKAGWKVWRIDAPMAIHDAAMTKFSQWWKRTIRTGYGYAQGVQIHGFKLESHGIKSILSSISWALIFPLVFLLGLFLFGPFAFGLLLIYPIQIARIYFRLKIDPSFRLLRASFLMIAKLPEAIGILRFLWSCISGHSRTIIEYKT